MTLENDDEELDQVVMQTQCVWCKYNQWAQRVYAVSHGEAGCTWCGIVPPVYYAEADYRAALDAPATWHLPEEP